MKKLFRILLLIVNVGVALLLLASTLAGFVPPSKFQWISVLSYGYFLLLLANILMAVMWLCFARKECLVSVAAIVLRFTFLPLFVQLGGSEEAAEDPEANHLTVLDMNVHMFMGPCDSASYKDTNAQLFVDMLHEEQPDVLVMQEFYVPNKFHLNDSLRALGYKHSYGPDRGSNGVPRGVAVYSKYPISYVQNIDKHRKFFVDITKQESIVRLVCVHLDSYELTTDNHRELLSATFETMDSTVKPVVKKLLETTKAHESEWNDELSEVIELSSRPIIMCGDFNDTPASYIYQKIKRHLKDCYVEQGQGFSTTYHGLFPNYRIDYIFHSESLKALSYKRIKNDISDHYAIKATLEL